MSEPGLYERTQLREAIPSNEEVATGIAKAEKLARKLEQRLENRDLNKNFQTILHRMLTEMSASAFALTLYTTHDTPERRFKEIRAILSRIQEVSNGYDDLYHPPDSEFVY